MKNIFTFLALSLSVFSFSQVFNNEYVKEDTLSKEQNYSNALAWASVNNKELRTKKITASDANIGMVSLDTRASLGEGVGVNYGIDLNIKIEVKDKKYKVSYLNPVFIVGVKNNDYSLLSSKSLKVIKENLQAIQSLSIKKFDSKLEWNYEDVSKAKNDYSLSVNEINILVDLLYKLENLQKEIDKSIDNTMVKNNDW
ncbi:hypothetical protein HZP25_11545 [Elizabethkingia anophelis]|nr:hypothetical protein [Elizabethkingia anophelis]